MRTKKKKIFVFFIRYDGLLPRGRRGRIGTRSTNV